MFLGVFKITKCIYFDTETTGLDFKNSRIIELAMLTVEDDEIIEEYDKFIRINSFIPPKIVEITGITDEMLVNEGVDEKIIAQDLKDRLTKGTLMIAHNAQFDLSFLYNLLKRHFPDEAFDIVFNCKWLDTYSVLKDIKEYPHKLIDAVHYYGIKEVNFHRAINDTKALYEVTKHLKDEYPENFTDYANVFGYNPKYGVNGDKFPFIEYKAQYYCRRKRSVVEFLPNK